MSECSRCSAPIKWVKMKSGKGNPLDPEPNPLRGNVAVDGSKGRVVPQDEIAGLRAQGVPLYVCHFVTCPHAHEFKPKWQRKHGARPSR